MLETLGATKEEVDHGNTVTTSINSKTFKPRRRLSRHKKRNGVNCKMGNGRVVKGRRRRRLIISSSLSLILLLYLYINITCL